MDDIRNVTAVILGGGQGSRLMPLTRDRAKPAVGFGGKYRLIDIPISNCINSGIRRQFVLTQFMSASLHRHIMQTYRFDNFSTGFVEILAAEQSPGNNDWFQGTADAVRATLRHTLYYDADQVLILSGDHLYRMDYRGFLKYHRRMKADITLCTHPVPFSEAPELGLVRADDSGLVTEFVEKPQDHEVIERFRAPDHSLESIGLSAGSDLCLGSMGIYVFEPRVLKEMLTESDETDFGKELIPSMVGKKRVAAYPFNGYWEDIGTIKNFFEAHIMLTAQEPKFPLFEPNWPFYTHPRALPPSRVLGSQVSDSLITMGCKISGAKVASSIIGTRTVIREGSTLKETILLGEDYYDNEKRLGLQDEVPADAPPLGIGHNCHIERAIIDKNSRIGDNVVIRGGEGLADYQEDSYWIRDGIVVVPKGAIIESGTVIGRK